MRIRRDKGVNQELQGIETELIAAVSDALQLLINTFVSSNSHCQTSCILNNDCSINTFRTY